MRTQELAMDVDEDEGQDTDDDDDDLFPCSDVGNSQDLRRASKRVLDVG